MNRAKPRFAIKEPASVFVPHVVEQVADDFFWSFAKTVVKEGTALLDAWLSLSIAKRSLDQQFFAATATAAFITNLMLTFDTQLAVGWVMLAI